MAQQVRNVTNIIINDRVAALSVVAVDGAGSAGLNPGEVGAFSADGLRVVNAGAGAGEINAAAVTSFFLARGSATPAADGYYKTDLINIADVTNASVSVTGVAGTNLAATEQQDTIGSDGTSGAIEVINNNLYLFTLYIQEYLTSSTDGRKIKHFQYHSDANALQSSIAIGLVGSAINNFSKEAEQYMAFKAVTDVAGATEANNVAVVRGTRTVLAAGALTAVVGDYLRFGTPAGGATTVDDVYKVASIAGLVYTLDRPLQVVSGNYVTGTFDCDIITAAQGDAIAANWGIDLLGQPLSFSVGKFFYKKTRWESSLKNFGTTNSTRAGNATKGSINGHDVLETEWFLSGYEGETYRMGEPTIYPFVAVAVGTEHYGAYAIGFNDSSLVSFSNNISPKMLMLAIPNNAGPGSGATAANAVTATGDSISSVLDEMLGLVGVGTASDFV